MKKCTRFTYETMHIRVTEICKYIVLLLFSSNSLSKLNVLYNESNTKYCNAETH